MAEATDMRRVAASVLSVLVLGAVATAEASPGSDALDKKLEAELGAIAPEAVPSFVEANRVRGEAPARALSLFDETLRLAPGFAAAHRRRCGALLALDRRDDAVGACRKAVEASNGAALDRAALATTLVAGSPRAAERDEASAQASQAAALAPDDAYVAATPCTVEAVVGDLAKADLCLDRLTVRGEGLAEARVMFAAAVIERLRRLPGEHDERELEVRMAKRSLEIAEQLDPTLDAPARVACQLALLTNDVKALGIASAKLEKRAPSEPYTHVFRAIFLAQRGDIDDALAAVERARAAGLPGDKANELTTQIQASRSPVSVWGKRLGWTLALWLLAFGVAFGAAAALGQIVLRQTERPLGAAATDTERRVRAAYAVVLWVVCALYYVSLPLVLMLALAAGAAVLLGMLAAGFVAFKLVILVAVVVFATCAAMLKSLFVRPSDQDPGERLALRDHPALASVLAEVASRVGTRGVDTVFMTPGTDIAVFERGGLREQLRGRAERCLVIGAAALQGLGLAPFKAILAHEHGHFGNRDTAGGSFALSVQRSLLAMARGLAEGGAAGWHSPAWLFLLAFERVFVRVSHGASRLQEILADRWAATTYGASAFEEGLRHVVATGVRFRAHAGDLIDAAVKERRPLENLYSRAAESALDSRQGASIEEAISTALGRTPSPYDSHPSPEERFRRVHALGVAEPQREPGDAWDLFADRAALEERMTRLVAADVAEATGIRLS